VDVRITAGTATQPTTEVTQSGASVGTVGHRITTTPSAAAREAARSDLHPVAGDRLEALVGGHRLVVEVLGHQEAALAHRPHAHHLVEELGHPAGALVLHRPRARHLAEAPGHPVEALARHRPRAHHLVVALLARQQAVGLAHPEQAAPVRLDRVHHPVALAQHEHPLAEAHRVPGAHAQVAVVSSVGEAAAHVRVVASLEVVRAPVEAASSVVVAADAALVDLEAADDDRFSLCNRWRLGFHHAA
jgi:hypothetical protein